MRRRQARSWLSVVVLAPLVGVVSTVGWSAVFPHAGLAAANGAEREGVSTGTTGWIRRPPLRVARIGLDTATVSGQILAIGGFDNVADLTFDSVEARRVKGNGRWYPLSPMRAERANAAAAGRHLYAIGGIRGMDQNEQTVSTVERYEPRSNTWVTVAPMREDRGVPGAVALARATERLIVVVGGAQGPLGSRRALRTTEVYSLDTGRWQLLDALLPVATASLACALESDGTVLAFGGNVDIDGQPVPTAAVNALRVPRHR